MQMPIPLLLALLGFMGILVGGPNNIISSAVAADLASHPSIKGNSRALGTVTGIINGSGSVTASIGERRVAFVMVLSACQCGTAEAPLGMYAAGNR